MLFKYGGELYNWKDGAKFEGNEKSKMDIAKDTITSLNIKPLFGKHKTLENV